MASSMLAGLLGNIPTVKPLGGLLAPPSAASVGGPQFATPPSILDGLTYEQLRRAIQPPWNNPQLMMPGSTSGGYGSSLPATGPGVSGAAPTAAPAASPAPPPQAQYTPGATTGLNAALAALAAKTQGSAAGGAVQGMSGANIFVKPGGGAYIGQAGGNGFLPFAEALARARG